MKTLGGVIAGAAAVPVVVVILLVSVIGGGNAGAAGSAIGGSLRPGAPVPPAYVQWVNMAGSTCAGVTPALIAAQIQQESGWNPNARSSAGAVGIAQFLPSTFATWGIDANADGTASPFDPPDAIIAQGRLMCANYAAAAAGIKDGTLRGDAVPLALAAYNAGMGAVHSAGGMPQIGQTIDYVASILALVATYAQPPTTPAGSGAAARIVAAAEHEQGLPYVWGGGTFYGPTGGGFDCSGLALFSVYQGTGGAVRLPHHAADQYRLGTPVAATQLQPGDLVFFNTDGPLGHVGIYLGNGQMIHAPTTGQTVTIVSLNSPYWSGAYAGARRYA